MEVEFTCSECGAVLGADADLCGGVIACPNCGTRLLVPAPAIRPGTTIGDFYIERKLGAGAMGEVYLATQRSLEREVAIKVLPPAMVRDSAQLERFLREVRLAGSLDHPNIVAVHAAGEDHGIHYLAMSFVKGQTLQEYLDKNGPMPENKALEITAKIAAALGYAWDKHRLIHRDIKPANIMIDAEGEPKLLDLGLAKRTTVDTGMTADGLVVGTPAFMSPEQADPRKEVDFRADIYSLGATLFNLVTGRRPFPGKNSQQVLQQAAKGLRVSPKEFNPALSDAACALIRKMMARRPEDRYPSWQAVVTATERTLAVVGKKGRQTAAAPPPAAPSKKVVPPPVQPPPGARRSSTGTRRRRSWTARLVVLFLLALAALAGYQAWRTNSIPRFKTPLRFSRSSRAPAPPRAASPKNHNPQPLSPVHPAGPKAPKPNPAPAPPPKFSPLSQEEQQVIEKQIDRRLRQETDSEALKRQAALKLHIPYPPQEPVLDPHACARAVNVLLQRKLNVLFPKNLEQTIRKQVEKQLALYHPNQKITVRLRATYGNVDRITGVFLGIRNNKVVVGPQRIPLGDVRKEDLIRLDPDLNRQAIEQRVKEKLAELEKLRKQKARELRPALEKRVYTGAGYIRIAGRWTAPGPALDAAVKKELAHKRKALREKLYREAGLVFRNGRWGRLRPPPAAAHPSQ